MSRNWWNVTENCVTLTKKYYATANMNIIHKIWGVAFAKVSLGDIS